MAAALSAALLLGGCGGDPEPNVTVTGKVETAKSVTQRNRLFGGSSWYELAVTADTGEKWTTSISNTRIDENDVRAAIGENVTFKCYRSDQAVRSCSALSLIVGGRERMHAPR